MKFLDALFIKFKLQGRGRREIYEGAGEAVLFVSVADAGWSAELIDRDGSRWKQHIVCVPDSVAASPPEQLALAIAQLWAEQPQAKVTRVQLLIDDPDLQLVDHRFAKLTNFEPRALREFGAQQAGARAIVFGSSAFGESSAREIEKRVLAFLPEEKLEGYFFALGKLATALTAVTPAGVQALRPQSHEGGIFATLRVHGEFSTLMIANGDNGILAVRNLPFGALTLAKAYASEHGLPVEGSSGALAIRSRLPPASALQDGGSPEHKTATFVALFPHLRQLHDDIAATIDYFRYQRLAGFPAHMSLTFTAPAIAGLGGWLGEALDLRVETVADTPPVFEEAPQTPMLNLLEGVRSGLLKLGNQPYEFSRGRLLPIKGTQSEMSAAKAGNQSKGSVPLPWLEKLLIRAAGSRLALRRELIMAPVCGLALTVFLVIANIYFLTAPAQHRLVEGTANYGAVAVSSIADAKPGSQTDSGAAERTTLWADNLFAVGRSLTPRMTLVRLELMPAAGMPSAKANLSFVITGALPQGSADLRLVAGFIDRLSAEPSFSRRFAQLRFTGAGESADEAHHEILFHVIALPGGAK